MWRRMWSRNKPAIGNTLRELPDLFLILIATLFACSTIGFHLGVPLSPYHLWGVLLVYFGIAQLLRTTKHGWVITLLPPLWLLMCAVGVSSFLDYSFDGTQYHQEAIIQLSMRWNPFREMIWPDLWDMTWAVWLNSLPKMGWTVAGVVSQALGRIESGKFLCLYLIPAIFLYGVFVSRESFRIARGPSLVVGFIAILNPIFLSQLLTNYMDGYVAGLASIAIFTCLRYFQEPSPRNRLLLAIALSMATLVKYTNLYLALALLLLLVVREIKTLGKTASRSIAGALGLGMLILSIFGFNPYATNLLRYGSLNYPMAKNSISFFGGSGPKVRLNQGMEEIIYSAHLPVNFKDKGRFTRFFFSLFARSEHASASLGTSAHLKWPFHVSKEEWKYLGVSDGRIAGFGPLFALISILSLCWMGSRRKENGPLLCVVGALWCAALANPYGWWARYVGYLWLTIPLSLLILYRTRLSERSKGVLGAFVGLAVCLNSLPILFVHITHSTRFTAQTLEKYERQYREHGYVIYDGYFGGVRQVLDERNIPFLPEVIEQSFVSNDLQIDQECFNRVYRFQPWDNPLYSRLPPMHAFERDFWINARKFVIYDLHPSPLFVSRGEWLLNPAATDEEKRICAIAFRAWHRKGFRRAPLL